MPYYNLFQLAEIWYKAISIYTTVEEASASAFTTSPRYEDEVELALDRLAIDISLDEVGEPVLWDALSLELCQQVPIPAEVLLDVIFGVKTMLLIETALPLQVTCQVVVLREVEALR